MKQGPSRKREKADRSVVTISQAELVENKDYDQHDLSRSALRREAATFSRSQSRTQPGVQLKDTFPMKFSALSVEVPRAAEPQQADAQLHTSGLQAAPARLAEPQAQSLPALQSGGLGLLPPEAPPQTQSLPPGLVRRIPVATIMPQKRSGAFLDRKDVEVGQPAAFFAAHATEKVATQLPRLSKLDVCPKGGSVYLSGLGGVAVFRLASGVFRPGSLDARLACVQLHSCEHHSDRLLVQEPGSNALKALALSLDPELEFLSQSPETDERRPQ